ncbi:hypothetical protein B0O99DRAFT_671912 [Bisporella sp. PMI_857]|nr:hypothetical protein B0O99DRAFT_671912 [Bisporella sp. PMI_857]
MDPVTISLSVVSAVAGIVATFKTSHDYFRKWRSKKRKWKKPAEEELENSLAIGSTEVDCQHRSLARIHGPGFESGDETSRSSLMKIALSLNQSLVQVLKESLHIGRQHELEPERLWRISDQAQKDAISTMLDLGQRIQISAPIPRILRERRIARQKAEHNESSGRDIAPINSATPVHMNQVTDQTSSLQPISTKGSRPTSNVNQLSSRRDSASFLPTLLTSPFHERDFQPEESSSFAISASFRSLNSTPLLPVSSPSQIISKSSEDLLKDWQEGIDERQKSISSTPIPSKSMQTSPDLPLFHQKQRRSVTYSSAPSTPSMVDPGVGAHSGREIRASIGRHVSDSVLAVDHKYGEQMMLSPRSPRSPITSLNSGFTLSLNGHPTPSGYGTSSP